MSTMKAAGLRVIRGPDWKWDDQDGGEGHLGTVVKPRFPASRKSVIDGTVFVRWDSGKLANYRISDCHDIRVYSSACAG